MAKIKSKNSNPVVKYGGVRMLQRRIKRSEIIEHNKEAVAQELIDLSVSKITDIIDWTDGKIKLKDVDEIPESALKAIKKVRVYGKESNNFEIELHDKVRSLQVVAKAAGLLEQHDNEDDRPAVIGIKIEGPDIIEIKESKDEKKHQPQGNREASNPNAQDANK